MREPASALRADAGFTLIEVVIAIVLIGASLLTVIGAASAAFAYQAAARQQQVATTIATKKMEEARALAFEVVSSGMPATAGYFSGDLNVSGTTLTGCNGETLATPEPIPTSATASGSTALSTALASANASFFPAAVPSYRVAPDIGVTVDGVGYGWATYITKPTSDAYHATVCVMWTDLQGTKRQTLIQSWIWSPQGPGCVGRPVTAVAGPCASLSATVPDGAVTIEVTHAGVTRSLSFALAGASAEISVAEATTATASFTASAIDPLNAIRPVDSRTVVTVDDDSATPTDASADTDNLAVGAIAFTTPVIYDASTNTNISVTGFQVKYESGTGRASSSVAPAATCTTGTATPSLAFPATWSAACAAAGLTRVNNWIDATYSIGDGFYVHPLQLTASPGFSFGAYVNLSAGSPSAVAQRRFNTVRAGLIPLDRGVDASSQPVGSMLFRDKVSLVSPPAVSVTSDTTLASKNVTLTTACNAILAPETIVAAGSGYGCVYPATPYTPTAAAPTTQIAYTWSWSYSPASKDDTALVDATAFPRVIRSSSPVLDLTLTVNRTYCSDFKKSGSCNATAVDNHVIRTTLSLGTSLISYDVVA